VCHAHNRNKIAENENRKKKKKKEKKSTISAASLETLTEIHAARHSPFLPNERKEELE